MRSPSLTTPEQLYIVGGGGKLKNCAICFFFFLVLAKCLTFEVGPEYLNITQTAGARKYFNLLIIFCCKKIIVSTIASKCYLKKKI